VGHAIDDSTGASIRAVGRVVAWIVSVKTADGWRQACRENREVKRLKMERCIQV